MDSNGLSTPASSSTSSSVRCKRKLIFSDGDEHPQSKIIKMLDAVEKYKPVLKAADMVIAKEYGVVGAKRVNTKFGERVVIELLEHQLFLPAKYCKLDDAVIEALNGGTYKIKNLGKNEFTYKYQFIE